eukprot:6204605-Prorocentrum_lima.AAC.1
MTSSLVGSEMCIRDREEAVECASFAMSFVPPPSPWGGPDLALPVEPFPCLLYTSDAADDM